MFTFSIAYGTRFSSSSSHTFSQYGHHAAVSRYSVHARLAPPGRRRCASTRAPSPPGPSRRRRAAGTSARAPSTPRRAARAAPPTSCPVVGRRKWKYAAASRSSRARSGRAGSSPARRASRTARDAPWAASNLRWRRRSAKTSMRSWNRRPRSTRPRGDLARPGRGRVAQYRYHPSDLAVTLRVLLLSALAGAAEVSWRRRKREGDVGLLLLEVLLQQESRRPGLRLRFRSAECSVATTRGGVTTTNSEEITVSGGSFNYPYYTFEYDGIKEPVLEVGKQESRWRVSRSDPFRITGEDGGLPITITLDEANSAPEYYCEAHSSMKATFMIYMDLKVHGGNKAFDGRRIFVVEVKDLKKECNTAVEDGGRGQVARQQEGGQLLREDVVRAVQQGQEGLQEGQGGREEGLQVQEGAQGQRPVARQGRQEEVLQGGTRRQVRHQEEVADSQLGAPAGSRCVLFLFFFYKGVLR